MPSSPPHMSMNKVIHGAVRRDLDRFRRALDAFDDGDHERATALHRAWANFEAEHEQMAADLASTGEAMSTLARTATRADADVAAAAMQRLQATTVTHLDHEERETEPTLAQHQGDPVMKEMGKGFSRRMGVVKAGVFFAWLRDGATADEESALTAQVPRPVLAVISGLFGRRYRKDVAPVWSH